MKTQKTTKMPLNAERAGPMTDASNASAMREWRRLLEISTAEAGKKLGLSSRAIEDIEQGRRRAGDVLTTVALAALIADAKKVMKRRK